MTAAIRYPAALRPGNRVGVTSPSAGVDDGMRTRLDFCVEWLTARGYEVIEGDCMSGAEVTSAPAAERAGEFTRMLVDPSIRAVVPPWGGELAVEMLPFMDFDAIARADPTWVVGYSDLSTLLVPLTILTGAATVHGQNLMDTPQRLPPEVAHWLSVVTASRPAEIVQSATRVHRSAAAGWGDYRGNPTGTDYVLDEPGDWSLLDDEDSAVDVSGTLIGGCIETLSVIAGSRWGDVAAFADRFAPDGTIVYVEAAESHALDIARGLWSLRLAGWFDRANAVLVGRTHAPPSGRFTQRDAVRSALGDLSVPVVLDVDCGHVRPQFALVNGARVRVVVDDVQQTLTQSLAT